jgi:hypothetical protein
MALAPGSNGVALEIQLRANLDEDDPALALAIALAAKDHLGDEATRLAVLAAERCRRFDVAVEFAEARLQRTNDPGETRSLALGAARTARDELHDDDRAAALLYQAHQADAEDVEVRLELTAIYARIPRLASHAVTGVLQLLRRTPDDARVYALAAAVAEQQAQPERAHAMRAMDALLGARPVPDDVARFDGNAYALLPIERDEVAARLAPTGWNGALQQLLALLAPHLEAVFLPTPSPLPGLKPLLQASPRTLSLAERPDRLLPGRVAQLMIADVERSVVHPGAVPQIVLPRDGLTNDAVMLATIARGIAVVRFGAVVTEALRPGDDEALLALLKATFLAQGRDSRAAALSARLREEDRQKAQALLLAALENPDTTGTAQLLMRACDRFALVVTGSPLATLSAAALPSLWRESPAARQALLKGSARALELGAFAARDNAWLLRRHHGL